MRIVFTIVFLLLLSLAAHSQNGTITGRVLDLKTKEAIIGASAVIQGTTVGAATDIDGNFVINNVKPGTYTIVVSFITYKTQTIPDVVVESGKKTTIEIDLPEDVAELAEVVVTAKKEIATDATLINSIRAAKLVVSGISSEQIAKLPDRDAAQVMQRVPGITIADNRFVLIRGVPERYNQVMINGIIGPSTEVDRRTFSFDLIPAGTLDQMLIYKSGSAELPGDFAGGVIQMVTKTPANEEFISFGASMGIRTNTTFTRRLTTMGSPTDWLGFDNGFRDIPEGFPSTIQEKNLTPSARERAGKLLTNNFDTVSNQTPIDYGFNFAIARKFNIGKLRASNFTSVAYSNGFQNYVSDFKRWQEFLGTSTPTNYFRFRDHYYSQDNRLNGLFNWVFEINDRNKIDFKNLFVQLGEDETTIRRGVVPPQLTGKDYQNYAYHYMSRMIYSGQLEGTHTLGNGSMKLNWVTGMNIIDRNEPDYRRFRTVRDSVLRGTEAPYQMLLPSSTSPFLTGRFWSSLRDESYSAGLNFEKKFGNIQDKRIPVFKAGAYVERKTRAFGARYLNYIVSGSVANPQALSELPLAEIFDPVHVDKDEGFNVDEGTTSTDSYTGENTLSAGYASGSIPVGKFDLAAGFRGEYNIQKLKSVGTLGNKIEVNNPIFAPLPFFNVAFNSTERSLVRFAYSRTVNRPEFRELAPFLYYQFEYEAAIVGKETLKTAYINNLDVRWEMYPNPGEALSFGAFYKQFSDPIELYVKISSDNPQFTYNNAVDAYSAGLEVEFKKSLASLGVSRFLRNTSLNLNAAWIYSDVDVGDSATNQAKNRPLQGQSPYIINFGLFYHDDESGFSFNTAYNIFGPRIHSVGDINYPSWWELPRHSVDVQVSKRIGKSMEVKFNVQNILNSQYRIYQDNNNDDKIDANNGALPIQLYQSGTQFSLAVQWKFIKN